jgi:cell filamentation protein
MVERMDDDGKHRRDRYDTSGNPEAEYVDAAQTVLRNLEGVSDPGVLAVREEELLAQAYDRLFAEVRMDTRLTCELLKYIHRSIFGPLYEWAGRYRTVWISKPGTTWPAPDFVPQGMGEFEQQVLRPCDPKGLSDDAAFSEMVAMIQGEFLVIHPFREGNARTIKLATDLLAVQSGRLPLKYDQSDAGAQAYIEAAKAAFRRQYAPMTAIIRAAMQPR